MKLDVFLSLSKLWMLKNNHNFSWLLVDLKSQIKLKLNASKSFQIVDVQNISEAMVVSEYHKARMSWVIQIVDAQKLSDAMLVFDDHNGKINLNWMFV